MKTSKLKFVNAIIIVTLFFFVSGCTNQTNKEALNKFQQVDSIKQSNIEIVKKFYKYLDEVNLDTLRILCSQDVKIYYESSDPISLSEIEPLIKTFYTSFPDYKHEIEDIFASDDKVVARIAYSGTHKNKFMDIERSGKKFKYKGIQIFQIVNNKVKNFWAIEDELSMMTQLGMELKLANIKK